MIPRHSFPLILLLGLMTCSCHSMSRGEIAIPQAQSPQQTPSSFGITPVTLLSNLDHPWGMAWTSGQDMLITERSGRLLSFSLKDQSTREITGLPPVFASGQGGLLDVVTHPRFQSNPWVYLTYAQGSQSQNRTTVARAKLQNNQLTQWTVIFSVAEPKSGTQHYGARLLWLTDGTLLVSIGDGGNPPLQFAGELIRNQAQNLKTHFGKVIRINQDGSIPKDNPVYGEPNAQPEIWTYGHRNIQGLALDSTTQQVWSTEHGARGGDELNLMNAGQNYGWPLVSFSQEYQADRQVAPSSSQVGFADPTLVWTPSIAPSGLAIYRGDRYPGWEGNIFSGALVNQSLVRISVNANSETTQEEEIQLGQRVRDVKQGPDGYLYILTDDSSGRLIRLEPK